VRTAIWVRAREGDGDPCGRVARNGHLAEGIYRVQRTAAYSSKVIIPFADLDDFDHSCAVCMVVSP
jgi:hypothetical protein